MRKISTRKFTILIASLLFCAVAIAQNSTPNPAPDDTTLAGPTVTFTQTWPDATPPFYSIAVSGTGSTAYQSNVKSPNAKPNDAGDPYVLKFAISPETQKTIFQIADQLNHFNGQWNFKKGRIAFTGKKTLSFKNGDQNFTTTYNWSDNVQIQQLTAIFQNISETVELGRKLAETYRYDKLGVDAVLKTMEEAAKSNRLAEIQAIQPILTKIANDSTLMNISRRRAEFLLTKIPKGVALAGLP